MADLKFKTRGMKDPGKKEKVYFCCHPDEFSSFFDVISDDILKKQNCAIWYRDEKVPYDEAEHLYNLSRMQLFVMPVTTKLLNTKNRALDVEFRFAVENHIPVLPLMQESGLVALFNEKCGDLQYLDKFKSDDTAISYDEKLSRFLSDILIGDDLVEKIRREFDAYVFLSYRKKDRKYAQELMRLIHKNDFCRDIAIWYDEFLTPGENFNDSIRDALEKSGLFVLAVTPNLVNEDNYIMKTEYPMAKDAKKPILPAELVPTDRDQLREKYKDIPDCTDARNDAALSDALLKAKQKMEIKEEDDSPEHNFFIGLAYLGGIDVEIDHARALSLITSAAEAGLKEAREKLVSMYMNGDGVERCFEKAIEWERRLADTLLEIYKSEPTPENLENWLITYIRISGKYSGASNDLAKSDAMLHELISICDSIAEETSADIYLERVRLYYKAQAYMYSGNKQNDRSVILEYLKKALAIFQYTVIDISNYLGKDDFYTNWIEKDYALCIAFLGEFYLKSNDIENAVSCYSKSNEILKKLYERYKNEGISVFVLDYVVGLSNIAKIHLLKYDCEKSEECYKEILDILDAEEEQQGTLETVPFYAEAALSFALVYKIMGDMEKYSELNYMTIKKLREYRNKKGATLYYLEYRAYVSQAQGYFMQQKMREVERYLDLAQILNEEHFSLCNKEIDEILIVTYYTLRSSLSYMKGDTAKARKEIGMAAKYADLCIERGLTVHAADCAGVYSEYARLEMDCGNEELGVKYIKKAIDTLEKYAFTMDDTRAQPMFVLSYLNYCAYKYDHGDMEGAIDYGLKCIKAYESFRETSTALVENININVIYYIVASAKYQLDKNDGRAYAEEKLAYFEKRVKQYGHICDYDGLAVMYAALCVIGKLFERSKCEKKAFEIFERMMEKFGDAANNTAMYRLLNQ